MIKAYSNFSNLLWRQFSIYLYSILFDIRSFGKLAFTKSFQLEVIGNYRFSCFYLYRSCECICIMLYSHFIAELYYAQLLSLIFPKAFYSIEKYLRRDIIKQNTHIMPPRQSKWVLLERREKNHINSSAIPMCIRFYRIPNIIFESLFLIYDNYSHWLEYSVVD